MKSVTILGATGSIGASTLDIIQQNSDKFTVYAVTGHANVEKLAEIAEKHSAKYIVLSNEEKLSELKALLPTSRHDAILVGKQALVDVSESADVDIVMAAIVGAAGLLPTLAAVRASKRVLLSNKESLVMAGSLFMAEVEKSSAKLLPVDSEHNAIFQSLPFQFQDGGELKGVHKIILTASGGPFRSVALSELEQVTVEQAVAHPNWSMGQKISIDSATMMNKGLEVIEACWLFNMPVENVEVLIHPQSTVHSMVQYTDGSTLAELGCPDMRTPIAHCMAWPDRIEAGVPDLDLATLARLDFEKPDFQRFPCLKLAFDAMKAGGAMPAVLNAANEIAVQRFIDQQIGFLDIGRTIAKVMDAADFGAPNSIDDVIAIDESARQMAQTIC